MKQFHGLLRKIYTVGVGGLQSGSARVRVASSTLEDSPPRKGGL